MLLQMPSLQSLKGSEMRSGNAESHTHCGLGWLTQRPELSSREALVPVGNWNPRIYSLLKPQFQAMAKRMWHIGFESKSSAFPLCSHDTFEQRTTCSGALNTPPSYLAPKSSLWEEAIFLSSRYTRVHHPSRRHPSDHCLFQNTGISLWFRSLVDGF